MNKNNHKSTAAATAASARNRAARKAAKKSYVPPTPEEDRLTHEVMRAIFRGEIEQSPDGTWKLPENRPQDASDLRDVAKPGTDSETSPGAD